MFPGYYNKLSIGEEDCVAARECVETTERGREEGEKGGREEGWTQSYGRSS
jgi:hypothetical protein